MSALDVDTRLSLRAEAEKYSKAVWLNDDLYYARSEEAFAMSDRIMVLNAAG